MTMTGRKWSLETTPSRLDQLSARRDTRRIAPCEHETTPVPAFLGVWRAIQDEAKNLLSRFPGLLANEDECNPHPLATDKACSDQDESRYRDSIKPIFDTTGAPGQIHVVGNIRYCNQPRSGVGGMAWNGPMYVSRAKIPQV